LQLLKHKLANFFVVFGLVFLVCYYSINFITGLAVPGGNYSSFVENYFNIADWVRNSLFFGSKSIANLAGYETYQQTNYVMRINGGRGIQLVYSCLGFAVMSFWLAYIVASYASLNKKFYWFFGGITLLWIINVLRISFVLIGTTKNWHFPLGWDHHTWFNLIAYGFIFLMIYFFERKTKHTTLEN
jgi:exosortase/archaeosortase family protein